MVQLLNIPSVNGSEDWKFLAAALVTVVTTYFLNKWEEAKERKKEKKKEEIKISTIDSTLRHNNEVQRNIKEILVQMQGYTECSRASLLSYHNGLKTHYEYSMNFVSMIEEKTDGIVAPIIDSFQRLPAAMFRPVIDRVEAGNEHIVVLSDETVGEERLLMDKYQNKSCYYFKVGNSVWEGVVELAWVNKNSILSPAEIDHVQNLVNNISNLQRKLIKP